MALYKSVFLVLAGAMQRYYTVFRADPAVNSTLGREDETAVATREERPLNHGGSLITLKMRMRNS